VKYYCRNCGKELPSLTVPTAFCSTECQMDYDARHAATGARAINKCSAQFVCWGSGATCSNAPTNPCIYFKDGYCGNKKAQVEILRDLGFNIVDDQ